jgi:hypothetical protein
MVGESTEPLSFHADMLKQHAPLIIWPKLFGDIRHFKWISLGTHDDDINWSSCLIFLLLSNMCNLLWTKTNTLLLCTGHVH